MRPFLRMAWRDALRHRARSILVLVMIALPVLGVTAAAVVIVTIKVSGTEDLDRRLGSAQAKLVTNPTRMAQTADPEQGFSVPVGDSRPQASLGDIEGVLGTRPATSYAEGQVRVGVTRGVADVGTIYVDVRSPLAAGLYRLDSGRLPASAGEVLISPELRRRLTGDRLKVGADGPTLRVVGVATSTTYRTAELVWGTAALLARTAGVAPYESTWLVGGPPVTWSQVRRLNDLGVTVVSRQVLQHPPTMTEVDPQARMSGPGLDSATVAVVALVVVMALLEVVLLAGPAFAVGARRQARTLALVAACGGTPRQARRVIQAGGLVLGGLASLVGVAFGLALAALVLPLAQRFSETWFGPFQIPWLAVLGIAAFGLVSALLAAVVPAWLASRQDVVAVLAGRRGDRPPSRRSPVLGVVLLVAGVVGAVVGSRGPSGEFLIAVSALVSVVGVIFVIPLVVAGLARLGRRLPLTLRYAVRDAARHRTRTVPAVAAVAATVAGVVALGIANASDAAQNAGTYAPQLPMGQAAVLTYTAPASAVPQMVAAVRRTVPRADVTSVGGVIALGSGNRSGDVSFSPPGQADGTMPQAWESSLGASVLVGDRLPAAFSGLSDAVRARASDELARGGAVVLVTGPVTGSSAVAVGTVSDQQGDTVGRPVRRTVPAYYLRWPTNMAPASAVVPASLARRLGVPVGVVGLSLSGVPISQAREKDLREAVTAIAPGAGVYVERGYQEPDADRLVLLVLGALGAILMLGGTLTATFLALSDARPDLATLSAVGAAPRVRRGVATSYAVVIGLVGAVLGAAVGFIPGIAVSYPLTANGWNAGTPGFSSHYLDIPWTLVLVLVVALPLVTALVVGLTARSRLPLVARLD